MNSLGVLFLYLYLSKHYMSICLFACLCMSFQINRAVPLHQNTHIYLPEPSSLHQYVGLTICLFVFPYKLSNSYSSKHSFIFTRASVLPPVCLSSHLLVCPFLAFHTNTSIHLHQNRHIYLPRPPSLPQYASKYLPVIKTSREYSLAFENSEKCGHPPTSSSGRKG